MARLPAGRRPSAILIAALLVLAGCSSVAPSEGSAAPTLVASPVASASWSASAPAETNPAVNEAGDVQLARFEVPPAPGPVKPWRGEMEQQVLITDGYATMYFKLRNTGEEPVTFLNLLYDYEPHNLYDPMVHAYWADGAEAATNQIFQSRAGRFFPSPAVLQPGQEGVYLMGGQPIDGTGTIGSLKTNIKYCPTRGMDDVQSQSLEVSDLSWETHDGVTTVRGTIRQASGGRRASAPTIGVAFFDAAGTFTGAVVDDGVGGAMRPGESRSFEMSGHGVRTDAGSRAEAWAWVR